MSVASEVFLLNPKHAGFLTNEERRFHDLERGSIILFFVVGVFFAGLGLVMVWQVLEEHTVLSRLENEGISATAHVTERGQSTSSDSHGVSHTTYSVTYTFKDARTDQSYTRDQFVSSDFYYTVYKGDTILIRYLPDDPTVSRIMSESDLQDFLLIPGATSLALDLAMLYVLIRQQRRNRRLIEEGQIVTGKISEITGQSVKGGYQVTVRYDFLSPYGNELSRKESLVRNDLRKVPLPAVGTPIAVVYVDDKLFRIL
jgi:hypothetical protein